MRRLTKAAPRTTYPITKEQAYGYRIEQRLIDGVIVNVKVYPPANGRADDVPFRDAFSDRGSLLGAQSAKKRKGTS